jgi:hypothetical protein
MSWVVPSQAGWGKLAGWQNHKSPIQANELLCSTL